MGAPAPEVAGELLHAQLAALDVAFQLVGPGPRLVHPQVTRPVVAVLTVLARLLMGHYRGLVDDIEERHRRGERGEGLLEMEAHGKAIRGRHAAGVEEALPDKR